MQNQYKQYVSIEEAYQIICKQNIEPQMEKIELFQANARILAEDVNSDQPVPAFEKSPLDGFAARHSDVCNATEQAPVCLQVVEEIPAGYVPQKKLKPGQASRIMTGAPLPDGADVIIKFEDTSLKMGAGLHYAQTSVLEAEAQSSKAETKAVVEVLRAPPKPGNYARIGEDMAAGAVVLKKGKTIDAYAAAVLATFGYHQVLVYKQPSAIVFSSGDELVNITEKPEHGKIRNSNCHALAMQISSWGARVQLGGIIRDSQTELQKKLLEAVKDYDLVVTTGGVSVGDYDYMKEVLQEMGAEILFWRVAMRPGTPMVVARYQNTMIFSLSGNPSAAFISSELFLRTWICQQNGSTMALRQPVKARLTANVGKVVNQTRYLRAQTSIDNCGRLSVRPLAKQKSGILGNMTEANALAIVPAGATAINSGDLLDVLLLTAPVPLQKTQAISDYNTSSTDNLFVASASIPIFAFSGFANSGKTTLLSKVIKILTDKGIRVATIKHDGSHKIVVDQAGKDTWQHRDAGALVTVISSAEKTALFDYRNYDVEQQFQAALCHISNVDVILVEGFKRLAIPKVFVCRDRQQMEELHSIPGIELIVTDFLLEQSPVTVYDIEDAQSVAQHIIDKYQLPEQ